jgi:hypothetical protein
LRGVERPPTYEERSTDRRGVFRPRRRPHRQVPLDRVGQARGPTCSWPRRMLEGSAPFGPGMTPPLAARLAGLLRRRAVQALRGPETGGEPPREGGQVPARVLRLLLRRGPPAPVGAPRRAAPRRRVVGRLATAGGGAPRDGGLWGALLRRVVRRRFRCDIEPFTLSFSV